MKFALISYVIDIIMTSRVDSQILRLVMGL